MHQSQGPDVTHKPKMTEELKRGALNITEQRSACKSAMESGISLMQGEPVSSRQCGRICVSIRKASDREQLHHPDITNTSRRTCSHHPPCLTSSKLILLCWIYCCQYRTDLYCWVLLLSIYLNFSKDISELHFFFYSTLTEKCNIPQFKLRSHTFCIGKRRYGNWLVVLCLNYTVSREDIHEKKPELNFVILEKKIIKLTLSNCRKSAGFKTYLESFSKRWD